MFSLYTVVVNRLIYFYYLNKVIVSSLIVLYFEHREVNLIIWIFIEVIFSNPIIGADWSYVKYFH